MAGSDYEATSGTLTFAAGETSKTISVPVINDTLPELAQTFTVTLTGPTGATLGTPATITVSITDNDGGAGFGSGVVNRPDETAADGSCTDEDCTLDDALGDAAEDGPERNGIRFAEGLVVTRTTDVMISTAVTLDGPGTIQFSGGAGLDISAGSDATPVQILDGMVIAGGVTSVLGGANALIQGSTLAGVQFEANSAGALGGNVAAPRNTITAGGVYLGPGADVNVSHNDIDAGGVTVDSLLALVFDNVIAGGLRLLDCGDDQVLTGNTVDGVTIAASGCLLGGSGAGNGNDITGAAGPGVVVAGTAADIVGNHIHGNGGAGVQVGAGFSARIIQNSIHDNGGLGIDIAPAGASGNRPAITAVTRGAGTIRVRGTLPVAGGYTLQLFSNAACDASGSGEGRTYLGEIGVATATAGGAFDVTLAANVAAGEVVTATITDGDDVTSEFSSCATAPGGPGPGPGPGSRPRPRTRPGSDVRPAVVDLLAQERQARAQGQGDQGRRGRCRAGAGRGHAQGQALQGADRQGEAQAARLLEAAVADRHGHVGVEAQARQAAAAGPVRAAQPRHGAGRDGRVDRRQAQGPPAPVARPSRALTMTLDSRVRLRRAWRRRAAHGR